MRIVAGMGHRRIRKEAIVQERAFKKEVDQAIEEVPDEQDTEFCCCGGMKETN